MDARQKTKVLKGYLLYQEEKMMSIELTKKKWHVETLLCKILSAIKEIIIVAVKINPRQTQLLSTATLQAKSTNKKLLMLSQQLVKDPGKTFLLANMDHSLSCLQAMRDLQTAILCAKKIKHSVFWKS